jgi:putative acetyltransferase
VRPVFHAFVRWAWRHVCCAPGTDNRVDLDQLRRMGAEGCVVLGDPRYYGRFAFTNDPELRYGDVPPEYFQQLLLKGVTPKGEVAYHPSFDAS